MRLAPSALAALLALSPAALRAEEPSAPKTYLTLEQVNLIYPGWDGKTYVEPAIDGLVFRMLNGKVGVFSAFYVDRRYSEAYAGPGFAPWPWLMIGAGAGIEHAPQASNAWRVGMVVWAGTEKLSLLTFAETGVNGPWGKAELTWRFLPWSTVGLQADSLVGVGPRLSYEALGGAVSLWGAPLYDHGDRAINGLIGLRLNL
jgi:hypothetical protein